ncbi:glucose-6-phosphate dehydrogenase [soil metagenome]
MSERADALVLFGVTGDLARKKLFPALHDLAADDRLPGCVVGVASSDWTTDDLRTRARDSIGERGDGSDAAVDALVDRLTYVRGDYGDPDTYARLRTALGAATRPLVYLAVPPSLFQSVIGGLAGVGLNEQGRIVVEKPFGRDLPSSRELNASLQAAFPEEAVFRIDHFLGKEELLDVLVFRLANAFIEPTWNRHHIASVQITMAEDFGVEGRGRFYEEVGTLRDVVQNHLLEIVAIVAMEPPVDAEARSLRDEKTKVLRAIRTLTHPQVVRGQFDGYRDEDGVAPDSQVETYVAVRLDIDSWRWAGVPFYIRAGKHLAVSATEVLVEFKPPPTRFFAAQDAPAPHPNHLVFRIKPGERVALAVDVKEPGDGLVSRSVELSYSYDEQRDGRREDAYARLLDDAMDGDQRLFARADGVEEAWRILSDVLADPGPVHPYQQGSWGPLAADDLIAADGGWHGPDIEEEV